MKRIKITFDTENVAFDENASEEIREILEQVKFNISHCNLLFSGSHIFTLRDSNGNTIGEMTIE